MRNKTIFISIVFLFLLVQIGTCQIDILNKLKLYIEEKFNVKLDSTYVITTHTRQGVYNYYTKEKNYDDDKSNIYLNKYSWKSKAKYFVDSIYSLDSSNQFNGFFIDYFGDSLSSYRYKYFKHGIKDSIEVKQDFCGSKKICRYKNGVDHGIFESFNNDGIRRLLTNYVNGKPVDTSYVWYDNGNLIAKRYYENDEIVWEKCYEEDGETEMECDF